MENENSNLGGTNWSPIGTTSHGIKEIPGASTSQILGILGLVLSLCAGCGVVGFVLSIIALVKGNRAIKEHKLDPSIYAESSFKQAKVGKILGIIGVIIGALVILVLIAYAVIMGLMAMNGGN